TPTTDGFGVCATSGVTSSNTSTNLRSCEPRSHASDRSACHGGPLCRRRRSPHMTAGAHAGPLPEPRRQEDRMWYRSPSALRPVGPSIALIALTACAGEPLPTGTPAPGASGQIVLTSIAWAGSHGYREVTRIDSATGRYSVHACVETHGAAACDPSGVVRE